MSRAYHASIGIFRQKFYTFDFGNSVTVSSNDRPLAGDFGDNFHMILSAAIDKKKVSQELAAKSNILTVGPITFNLETSSATFRGCRLGPSSWIATEYADSLIMTGLPATGEEIAYLVKSLIHLFTST